MPVGMMNMLTTACSKPSAKKVKIGSQVAAIFPTVELDVIAITTPRQTSQLQRMPLTNTLTRPAVPSASLAIVLASAVATMRAATPATSVLPMLVSEIAISAPKAILPIRLATNTQDQLAITAPQVALPSKRASGTRAKLPVTSSSPSSTIITSDTGKVSAP